MGEYIKNMKTLFDNWVEKSIITIINDIGELGSSLYPLFIITCIVGIYVNMAGAKQKGTQISSLSFLAYLILKVMASV